MSVEILILKICPGVLFSVFQWNRLQRLSHRLLTLTLPLLMAGVGLYLSACKEYDAVPPQGKPSGEVLFTNHCSGCHASGGNTLNPSKPIKGSSQLANAQSFSVFVRNPGPAMPPFGPETLSDEDLKCLYDYLAKNYGSK